MTTLARISLRRADAPKRVRRSEVCPAPVVKWAGGKTRLLAELDKRKPMTFGRYFEPFMGGGALFFHLRPESAVLTDWNEDLVNMYECVAWNVESVIRRLQTHRRKHCEEHYYATRTKWNDPKRKRVDVERAAAFIYMNKTCYNGLWRVNRKGEFNVPMGRYVNPTICMPAQLRAASKLLQRCDLSSGSYIDGVSEAGAGDFVYFDPPYDPITETADFTSYTSNGFGRQDQRELSELARELRDRGAHVMVSNHDTPFIRKLYRGFKIDRVQVSRAINSNAKKRGAVAEVIITSKHK